MNVGIHVMSLGVYESMQAKVISDACGLPGEDGRRVLV